MASGELLIDYNQNNVTALAISNDGSKLITGVQFNTRLYNLVTGELLKDF